MPAWFDVYDLTPKAPEDDAGIEAAVKYVHSLIDAEVAEDIPADRIVICGHSMGGALALYAGLTYKHKLAGICSLSGWLLQRDKLPGNHSANKDTPIWLGHGTADPTVAYAWGEMAKEALEKHFNVAFHTYKGVKHTFTDKIDHDLKSFIEEQLPDAGEATDRPTSS